MADQPKPKTSFETANGTIHIGDRVRIMGGDDHSGATGIVETLYFPPDPRMGMADVRVARTVSARVRGVYLFPIS